MKRTKCKSGIEGWAAHLQSVYSSFEEFENISDMYGIAARLGYSDNEECWLANPKMKGSVVPSDLSVVR
jgi:hypothetical protein